MFVVMAARVVEVPVELGKFIAIMGSYESARRIPLIKALREVSSLGLRESKDTVDALIIGDYVEDKVFNMLVVNLPQR